jgi:hypothetical protein
MEEIKKVKPPGRWYVSLIVVFSYTMESVIVHEKGEWPWLVHAAAVIRYRWSRNRRPRDLVQEKVVWVI